MAPVFMGLRQERVRHLPPCLAMPWARRSPSRGRASGLSRLLHDALPGGFDNAHPGEEGDAQIVVFHDIASGVL
jgi:hypothetical protein